VRWREWGGGWGRRSRSRQKSHAELDTQHKRQAKKKRTRSNQMCGSCPPNNKSMVSNSSHFLFLLDFQGAAGLLGACEGQGRKRRGVTGNRKAVNKEKSKRTRISLDTVSTTKISGHLGSGWVGGQSVYRISCSAKYSLNQSQLHHRQKSSS